MRRTLIFAVATLTLFGQTPSLSFEVAVIKPATQPTRDEIASGIMRQRVSGSNFQIGYATLETLLVHAFQRMKYQIEAPDWIKHQGFSLSAKLPEGATRAEIPRMLQALLGERFRLSVRMVTKERSAFALTVGKGGPRLTSAPPEVTALYQPSRTPEGGMRLRVVGPIEALAEGLASSIDLPIVDLTSLPGKYDISLEISRDELMATADPRNDPADPWFTAVERVGLKLERQKLPLEIVVVDHIEKMPTAN